MPDIYGSDWIGLSLEKMEPRPTLILCAN